MCDVTFLEPQISFFFESQKLRIEIETQNLFIRTYSDEDFENCVALYGDEKLTKLFDHGKPRSHDEVKCLIEERSQRYLNSGSPLGLFSIFNKSDRDFVGQCDLLSTDEDNNVEFGCILLKKYHNSGYALEIGRTFLYNLTEAINKQKLNAHPIKNVIATSHPKNYASQRLIKNMGMRFDKSEERFGLPRLWYSRSLTSENPISTQHKSLNQHNWSPNEYYSNSSIQSIAADLLLKRLNFNENEQILDVGCGDGKISANIAERLKNGAVLGIDLSSEMINFSRSQFPKDRYPNLEFQVQDGQYINYERQFDVIFSSFAVQWFTDLNSFFLGAKRSLKPSGQIALTIPLNISFALEESIRMITNLPNWKTYFVEFSPIKLTNETEYKQHLQLNKFSLTHFSVVTQEFIFDSRIKFEKYVFPWFPYSTYVPASLKQDFFRDIIEQYLILEPVLDEGRIRFTFNRVDIIAKPIL